MTFDTMFGFLVLVPTICAMPAAVPRSASYESVTDQLFQIVRGVIMEQQAFEKSMTAQLETIKSIQNQFEPMLRSESLTVRNLETKVALLSEKLSLRQVSGNGEFYSQTVRIYQGLSHGDAWDLQVPTNPVSCTGIPAHALHKVSSIDTNGLCVILFKGKNCSGRGVRFSDFSYGADDFGRIGFHDQATSYRSC